MNQGATWPPAYTERPPECESRIHQHTLLTRESRCGPFHSSIFSCWLERCRFDVVGKGRTLLQVSWAIVQIAASRTCLESARRPSPSESLLCFRLRVGGNVASRCSMAFWRVRRPMSRIAASSSGTRKRAVCMTCIFCGSTPISRAHGISVGSTGREAIGGGETDESRDECWSAVALSSSVYMSSSLSTIFTPYLRGEWRSSCGTEEISFATSSSSWSCEESETPSSSLSLVGARKRAMARRFGVLWQRGARECCAQRGESWSTGTKGRWSRPTRWSTFGALSHTIVMKFPFMVCSEDTLQMNMRRPL